jgi:hypothetical protein
MDHGWQQWGWLAVEEIAMGSFLEEYTNRVTVELHGQPDSQFVLQWNGGQKRLELLVTFNVEKLLEKFAANGDITINTIPSSRKVTTITFKYPVPDEVALRKLTHAMSSGLVSMGMGIAKDLAGKSQMA